MPDDPTALEHPELRGQTPSVFRRLIMPLLIVVVAGGILIWGRQSEESNLRDVQEAVHDLCHELYHSPPGGSLPELARQMSVRRSVADRIHTAFGDADWDEVRIDVRNGDTSPPFGDGHATHHAILYVAGQQRIGLRLVYRSDVDHVDVLGYWLPGHSTSPQ